MHMFMYEYVVLYMYMSQLMAVRLIVLLDLVTAHFFFASRNRKVVERKPSG